jgi:hypothetical protein
MHWIADFLFFQHLLDGLCLGEGAEAGEIFGPFHNLCANPRPVSPKKSSILGSIFGEFGDGSSCGRECNTNCAATPRKNHTTFYAGHRLAPFKFKLTHINWQQR